LLSRESKEKYPVSRWDLEMDDLTQIFFLFFFLVFPPSGLNFSSIGKSSKDDINEQRRNAHIASEKKRRNNIRAAFSELKDIIPSTRDKAVVSKAAILRHGAGFFFFWLVLRNAS
jgi:hypothetical protein